MNIPKEHSVLFWEFSNRYVFHWPELQFLGVFAWSLLIFMNILGRLKSDLWIWHDFAYETELYTIVHTL